MITISNRRKNQNSRGGISGEIIQDTHRVKVARSDLCPFLLSCVSVYVYMSICACASASFSIANVSSSINDLAIQNVDRIAI